MSTPAEWREFKADPWLEAERQGVRDVCRRMGWSRKRLDKELNRVASADAFLNNVAKALQDLDKPRLMHKNPAMPPTSTPGLAARGEMELVPAEYENELAKENREKDMTRATKTNEARKNRPLPERLASVIADAKLRGINLSSDERNVVRKVEQMERKVDRV